MRNFRNWPEGRELTADRPSSKLMQKLPVVKRPAGKRGGPTGVLVARCGEQLTHIDRSRIVLRLSGAGGSRRTDIRDRAELN
jgi:hypothetical protein